MFVKTCTMAQHRNKGKPKRLSGVRFTAVKLFDNNIAFSHKQPHQQDVINPCYNTEHDLIFCTAAILIRWRCSHRRVRGPQAAFFNVAQGSRQWHLSASHKRCAWLCMSVCVTWGGRLASLHINGLLVVREFSKACQSQWGRESREHILRLF